MARVGHAEPVYHAAARWRDACLLDDGSVFTKKSLWTIENLGYLDRYFVQNLDYGEGDFYGKLEKQLGPAPAEAKQLAAEMFWMLFLFSSKSAMSATTKRVSIQRVWEWSGDSLPEAGPELGDALEEGIGNPGAAFNTLRWKEFEFFVVMMLSWKRLSRNEQRLLLSDPWEFSGWVDSLEKAEGRQFRHILLHLLFPDVFERIGTAGQKREIVQSFGEKYRLPAIDVYDRLAVDRQLLLIRESAEKEYEEGEIDFYQPRMKEVWRRTTTTDSDGYGIEKKEADSWYTERFDDRRIWAWSPGQGARMWSELKDQDLIAIGWDYLGDLMDYESREAIAEAIKTQRGSETNPTHSSLACWQFSREVRVGDVVLAKRGFSELLGYGIVTSGYEYREERAEFRNVRRIDWKKIGSWALGRNQRIAPKALTEFTSYTQWLYDAFQLMEKRTESSRDGDDGNGHEELFISEAKFSDILDALARKKNIILQGPPGVGKTFVARSIATAMIGRRDAKQVRMIQFHQSYAYEDFVQGWRPTEKGGFKLRDGVFHSFCTCAQKDPDNNYVMIIDEINRGNLSRIFGDLLMLIEGDKRGEEFSIPLTYSSAPFCVPQNLFLIGTMNTADRSLALVDYALRRRFIFIDLLPAFGNEAFVEYLATRGVEESMIRKIVERMKVLNQTIREDGNLGVGYEIGHSYFCPQEGDEELDEAWFEKVIRHEIAPLLREYWFDDRRGQAQEEIDRLLT